MSDCEVGPKKALVETFEQRFFGTFFMDLQELGEMMLNLRDKIRDKTREISQKIKRRP